MIRMFKQFGDAVMPISDSDPRVFFAAERTLLAWLRTGLTIIALGFVIALLLSFGVSFLGIGLAGYLLLTGH